MISKTISLPSTKLDIENGVNLKIDKFMLGFLSIYDDFILAKKILNDEKF